MGSHRYRRISHLLDGYVRPHTRRFHGSNTRQTPYLPHQWLYNRQQVMQEAYRRHMFDSFDSMVYENRYIGGTPYERRRDNYHGIGLVDRPPLNSPYWGNRRTYPYSPPLPHFPHPFDTVRVRLVVQTLNKSFWKTNFQLLEDDHNTPFYNVPAFRRFSNRGATQVC